MAFIYNLTDSWNDVTTTWNGIKLAVTNTASDSSSKLLNLTVSGATTASFVVDKSGNLDLNGKINKITFTAPATAATFTLADNSTFATVGAHSATFTFTGTTAVTFPTSGTVTALGNSTTGSGDIVLATSPTLVTPNLGTPSSATLTNATGLPVATGISGLGTGVATALAANVGNSGAFVTFGGALGTPSSGNLSNCTGYAIGNISGLGSGVATWLGTPSSANLAAAVTDETGSGSLVFATSPTLVTPNLGTPSAATLTNATGLPISTGVSGLGSGVATFLGTPSSANLASAVTDETGSGSLVFGTSPTIATPTITGAATFNGSTSGTVALKAPAVAGTTTFQLPAGNGTSGYVLVTDGLGNTSWAASGGAAGNAAGINKNVQFNDAGSMAGNAAFNFDKATDTLSLGVASTTSGKFALYNSASANAVTVASGNNSAAWTLTLPTSGGTNGYALTTDGSGNTSWSAVSSGLNVGSTSISGGTSGRILYDNAGTLGEKTVTGTGDVVLATNPTLITPTLGVASATSVNKVAITAPATGSTLTIADGKTLTASNTLTFTGTDSSSVAFGTGGTVAYTGGTLAQFASTTSAQLAGVISDETGSGSLVFATSPTLTTPVLGTPTSGTLTNCTGLPVGGISATGTPSSLTYLRGDGSWNTVTAGAAGSTTQIQYNNAGALAGSANYTFDGTNVALAGTLAMGSSFLRNRIINGGMGIDQRNAGAAQTVTASQVYCVDRWITLGTATNCTVQRVSGDSEQQYALRILRGSGTSTGYVALFQTIETVNCYDLAGKTITVSFRARKGSAYSAPATIQMLVVTGSGTDQGSGGVTGGTWTSYATSTPTLSGTLTTSFSTFTATASIPAGTNEIALYFSTGAFSGTGSANDYIDITGVQLEVGSVATPFERRLYGQELALCQRYLPAWRSDGTASPISAAFIPNATTGQFNIPFIVQPRVAPTGITVSNVAHFSIYSTAAYAATNTVLAGANLYLGIVNLTISGATAGQGAYGYFNNASGYLLFTGCEL